MDHLGERRAYPIDVVQCEIVHCRTAKVAFEKETFGVVFAPYSDVAKLKYLKARQPIRLEWLARERLCIGHDKPWDVL
jgi:hypothetical protein